jgi:hypothetical protein
MIAPEVINDIKYIQWYIIAHESCLLAIKVLRRVLSDEFEFEEYIYTSRLEISEESPPQKQHRKESNPSYRSPFAQHGLQVDIPGSSFVLGRLRLEGGRQLTHT